MNLKKMNKGLDFLRDKYISPERSEPRKRSLEGWEREEIM